MNIEKLPIELVCCYASDDEAKVTPLLTHLKGLESPGLIKIWYHHKFEKMWINVDKRGHLLSILSFGFSPETPDNFPFFTGERSK